jgi:CelD/BcsL family acetyltransferase involved in cellulose biosynthesis
MIEIHEINSLSELASYQLSWNSWLPQTPRASFVNTFEWLELYWRYYGQNQSLRALVAKSSGTPIGIVPLCVRVERRRVGQVRVLTYPFDNWGAWYGPLGSNVASTMLAAAQYLRHAPRDWDVLDLPNTAGASQDSSRTSRSLCVVGLGAQQRVHRSHSVVDIPGEWSAFLDAKPRKMRHEIRRVLRTFERPDIEFVRHRPEPARAGDGDPRWDLYAMCEHVALASWQASSTTGNTLTHEHVRPFLREAHAAAARRGMVDMNLAIVDGRPAAFAYNYCYDGRVSVLRIGYDPAAELRGVGTALLLRMLEDGCQRGDQSYDLGPGDARFQCKLRTHVDTTYRLTHWPLGSWRSSAMRIGQWARRRIFERVAS